MNQTQTMNTSPLSKPLTALVTGATNQIGHFLLPRLQAAGFMVTAYSRTPPPATPEVNWQCADLLTSSFPNDLLNDTSTTLFHLAPLPLLPPLLERLPDNTSLKRVIAFSSTSRFTKENSPEPKEREVAKQLIMAENRLITVCQQRGIPWTVFRPTLIYGCGLDKNVTTLANFIRRFGFFPIVGQGQGLRQPVHAEDLAMACVQACESSQTLNRAYNLSGGQTLTYREMIETIFRQLGKTPHIISIPLPMFQGLVRCLTWWSAFAHVSTAMIARMNQNLCFDHTEAWQDFGYQPRRFKI